ncbi:Rap1 GTPase-activating protein 1 [Balamuthia mandrillaris]
MSDSKESRSHKKGRKEKKKNSKQSNGAKSSSSSKASITLDVQRAVNQEDRPSLPTSPKPKLKPRSAFTKDTSKLGGESPRSVHTLRVGNKTSDGSHSPRSPRSPRSPHSPRLHQKQPQDSSSSIPSSSASRASRANSSSSPSPSFYAGSVGSIRRAKKNSPGSVTKLQGGSGSKTLAKTSSSRERAATTGGSSPPQSDSLLSASPPNSSVQTAASSPSHSSHGNNVSHNNSNNSNNVSPSVSPSVLRGNRPTKSPTTNRKMSFHSFSLRPSKHNSNPSPNTGNTIHPTKSPFLPLVSLEQTESSKPLTRSSSSGRLEEEHPACSSDSESSPSPSPSALPPDFDPMNSFGGRKGSVDTALATSPPSLTTKSTSFNLSKASTKKKGSKMGKTKKKFSSLSRSTFRTTSKNSSVSNLPWQLSQSDENATANALKSEDPPSSKSLSASHEGGESSNEPSPLAIRKKTKKGHAPNEDAATNGNNEDVYAGLGLTDTSLSPAVQKDLLNKFLMDQSTAKAFIGEQAAQYVGLSENDIKWISKPVVRMQWFDDYEENPDYPHMIKHVPGYQRELGRPAYLETYRSVDKKTNFPFMEADQYRYYFKDYIYGKEHDIYISHLEDEEVGGIGPTIICIETPPEESNSSSKDRLKVLILNKKGTERTTIANEGGSRLKTLKQAQPHLLQRFVKVKDPGLAEALLDYEDKLISEHNKFGVLYCKDGQVDEDEMYNNEHGSPAFNEFLDFLGERTRLNGHSGFRGGLDVKTDTTGTHSVYTKYRGFEIMFHVSTLLPYFPDDPQQVERKRHLGNDVVLVIFREGEHHSPFDPTTIHSQFNHVFVIVQPDYRKTKGISYRVAVGTKFGVRPFGPLLPEPASFKKGRKFREFLLTKLINAERAALYAPDFVGKLVNTRKVQLHDIIERFTPQQTAGSKVLGRK